MSIVPRDKIDTIKNHLLENRHIYVALAAGVGVGVLLGNQQAVKQFSIRICSPGDNIVVADLVRRGHPGFMVRCKETGEVFASKSRAAAVLGVNRGEIEKFCDVIGEMK